MTQENDADQAKNDKEVIDNIYQQGQEHVFNFWNEISDAEKSYLLEQLGTIDFDNLNNLVKKHIINPVELDSVNDSLSPAPCIQLPKTQEELSRKKRAKDIGEKYLREGKIGVFMVAGGQGSRLGYDGPKGCFNISPINNKSIFQLHSEQIGALEKKHNVRIPFYIMTSQENHQSTKDFFGKNDYFGLSEVHFFSQDMMPAVDAEGKLILSKKGKIFMNPNGHGGSIVALKNSGALDDMKKKGIEMIYYFQVDNILAKIADPVFIGYHVLEDAQMSSKAVEKRNPEEKVGVIGLIGGKTGVIEYSVLPDNLKQEKEENNKLKFSAGNIAIHIINTDFVERLNNDKTSLPFYKAFKKIPYISEDGQIINPSSPNAYKFEMFVFDALKKTTNSVTMMVDRNKEFAPVKNASGDDSPEQARKMISNLHKSWIRKSGFEVDENTIVEISPYFAIDEEEAVENLKLQQHDFSSKSKIYLE